MLDLDEYHESMCCDEHSLHHEHGEFHIDEYPIGGCWTCAIILFRTIVILATNLAIGAALCLAARVAETETLHRECTDGCEYRWRPGCGRVASGYRP